MYCLTNLSMTQFNNVFDASRMHSSERNQPKSFHDRIEKRLEKLEEAINSRKIDVDEFREELEERFGDDAKGVVSKDGRVDFDKLRELMLEQNRADGGPPPAPPQSDDSTFLERLQEHFGDAANDIVGEDGEVDFTKVQELIHQQLGTSPSEDRGPFQSANLLAGISLLDVQI